MTKQISRRKATPRMALQAVQTYLYYRLQEAAAAKEKDKAYSASHVKKEAAAGEISNPIVAALLIEGTEDETTGSIFWTFPAPINVESKTYAGMEYRCKRSPMVDEKKAQELARKNDIIKDVVTREITLPVGTDPEVAAKVLAFLGKHEIDHDYQETWDYDQFYVLNQQGKIPDEDIDSMTYNEVSYSLYPTEA